MHKKGLEHLRSAEAIYKRNGDILNLVSTQANIAQDLIKNEKYDEALKAFLPLYEKFREKELNPQGDATRAWICFQIGRIYHMTNKKNLHREWVEKTMRYAELSGEHISDAAIAMSYILWDEKRPLEALRYAEKANNHEKRIIW